jgi:aspartyl-tRNA(Asn)/glutamyl-tRNA(Gln) amidotransferase subunit A
MRHPETLAQARRALDAGEYSAVALLEHLLELAAIHEPTVKALTTSTFELARRQAAEADTRLASGERTPLLGIPVVVKDLIDVAGIPTTAGSKVLAGNVPAGSSTVWARLAAAGAVLVGKVNTHEFAYGGTTAPTRNPADTSRIVGGSSGGSAAALAAGFALGALGSDTAGSVRIPANLCGVPGLKTTRGLVPVDGVVPLSPTLDVVGPMARSVADLDPLLRVIAGLPDAPAPAVGVRTVGILQGTGALEPAAARAVAATTAALTELGAVTRDVELPGLTRSVYDDFTIIGYEAHRFHEQWADRRELYTPYVRDRLAAAASISRAEYEEARAGAARLTEELDRLLGTVDVLVVPGVPFAAPPAYDEQVLVGGDWEDRDTALCRNLAFANLTGHPSLALPGGMDGELPVGVQLVGRRGSDLALVDLGSQLEPLLPRGLPRNLREGWLPARTP